MSSLPAKRSGGPLDEWYPVQVKQKAKAGRPDIDSFKAVLERENRTLGYFVAFEFTRGAILEARAYKARTNKDIILRTVKEMLDEVAPPRKMAGSIMPAKVTRRKKA